jgi:predicted transcriptional regulator of viral defense system
MDIKKLREYLKHVRVNGRQYFTLDQVVGELHASRNGIAAALYRIRKRGEIISPAKGLYVIVPPEHQRVGCIPAADLVPILMRYWGVNYYAGLLTAALYHGASHQKPQVFQILSNKRIKKQLVFGQICIDCIYKRDMGGLPTQEVVVHSGHLKISSPELTALDLLLYPRRSGGLNRIATVLSELIESIDPDKLIAIAQTTPEKAWLQRLGYIVEKIKPMDETAQQKIIHKLQGYLVDQGLVYVRLASEISAKGAMRCSKWKIIENTTIEGDA